MRILGTYAPVYHPIGSGLREVAGGFSGARLWKIDAECGTFCLRRMDASSIEPARLLGLHRLLRHVHAAGVAQVAVPVGTAAGTTVVADRDFLWQLEPWMPGTADFARRPNRLRLASAMECLARFHAAAATFVPAGAEAHWFFRRVAPSPGIRERMGVLRNWDRELHSGVRAKLFKLNWPEFVRLGTELIDLFERLAEPVRRQLVVAEQIEVPLQPCLRDVWHDHVLFTADEATGLVDPFASRSDSIATDLARLLGSLLQDDHVEWDYAMEVYHCIRPLECEERALIEVFDASGTLLAGMTWLDWVCIQERAFADRARVISRVATIVTRIRALSRRFGV